MQKMTSLSKCSVPYRSILHFRRVSCPTHLTNCPQKLSRSPQSMSVLAPVPVSAEKAAGEPESRSTSPSGIRHWTAGSSSWLYVPCQWSYLWAFGFLRSPSPTHGQLVPLENSSWTISRKLLLTRSRLNNFQWTVLRRLSALIRAHELRSANQRVRLTRWLPKASPWLVATSPWWTSHQSQGNP